MGRRFELRIDHCGMKYLFYQPTLNARQGRWMEFLCDFDFEIKHINGKENKVVDALSRKVQEMHVASISICQSELKVGDSSIWERRLEYICKKAEFF